MRLLALDTSTRATSAAAWDTEAGDPVELRDDPPACERPAHATRALELAEAVLARQGWEYPQLERIAVGRGPGTFTGLRVGVATARSLAHGLGLPLTGVSSLESLAYAAAAAEPGAASLLAVLDARRGELFAAAYQASGGGALGCLVEPQVVKPAGLAALLGQLPDVPLAVGDGAVAFRQVLAEAGATVAADDSPLHRVSAAAHCRLAAGRPGGRVDEVLPDYLRLPDAEISRSRARGPSAAPDAA